MSANTSVGFLYGRHYCFNLQHDILSAQELNEVVIRLVKFASSLCRTKSTSTMYPDSRAHTLNLCVLSPFIGVTVNEDELEN